MLNGKGLQDCVKAADGTVFHVSVILWSDTGNVNTLIQDDYGYTVKYSDYPTKLVQDKVKELTKILVGS